MDNLTLDKELLDNILDWMEFKAYSANTIKVYGAYLAKLFLNTPVLNKESLRIVLKKFKHQNQRAVLQLINSYCWDNKIDFHLIVPSIRRKPPALPSVYSMNEIKIMVESAPKPYDLLIRCIFNMGAGLRVREGISLSWYHIKWADWIQNKDYGQAIIKDSKKGKSRVVNIPKKLMEDLYEYAKELKILNEFGLPDGALIFSFGDTDYKPDLRAYNLKKWKQEYIKHCYDWFRRNIIQKYCEKALSTTIKIHNLRHCVSEDTEILTVDGWKKYYNLSIGEKILNYNLSEDSIKSDKIINIHKYDYNGKLIKIKNRYVDTLITPEHKIVIREKDNKDSSNKWEIKPVKDIKIGCWNLSYKLSSKLNKKEEQIGTYKAGILGWILSDGSISNREHPSISISQSLTANKLKCEYIENLLEKSGIKYTKIEKERINTFNNKKYILVNFQILKGGNRGKIKGTLHNWIYEYINMDRTPKLKKILELSFLEIEELYKCMMMGDGTNRTKYPDNREYAGQNGKRIELIRILCSVLGNTSIVGTKKQNGEVCNRTYIRQNKDYTQIIARKHMGEEEYNGVVWCPETNNGTFIAKRNEKIFITGNSRATYLYEIEKVPIEKIQILLGHSDLSTTMIYTKVNPISVFESLKNTREV